MWISFVPFLIPSLLLAGGAVLIAQSDRLEVPRRRLFLLMFAAPVTIYLLAGVIWTNPYGRHISSSVIGFGVLIVLVALLVLLLNRLGEIARLRRTDLLLLVVWLVLMVGGFVFLYITEPLSCYIVLGMSAFLGLAWWLGTRSGLWVLVLIGVAALAAVFLGAGGSFFIPGAGMPDWLRNALQIAGGLSMVVCLILAAALVYRALRRDPPLPRGKVLLCLAMAAVLVVGSAYFAYWEGIWSSAHARAFEDHLPFAQFMVNLLVGVLLVILLLRRKSDPTSAPSKGGPRYLAGPAFTILATTITVLAFILGWRVSAFEITKRRAERVESALQAYYQDHGRYPQALGELAPRYQLVLLPPVVVRIGGWCYQGGGDSYRLGFVSGQFTYFDSQFRTEIAGQAGQPEMGDWPCDELVRRLQAGGLIY
jgi:hypothetical protein